MKNTSRRTQKNSTGKTLYVRAPQISRHICNTTNENTPTSHPYECGGGPLRDKARARMGHTAGTLACPGSGVRLLLLLIRPQMKTPKLTVVATQIKNTNSNPVTNEVSETYLSKKLGRDQLQRWICLSLFMPMNFGQNKMGNWKKLALYH